MHESAPNDILNTLEKSMYKKFMENPAHAGMTEADFKELRDLANKRPAMHNFFAVNGIIMEESELPSAEEIKDTYR